MAKDLTAAHIYGDTAGAVWVGAVGVTFPTLLAAPTTGWSELGWISEDGVNIANESDNVTVNAWQGGKEMRTRVTSSTDQFTFTALEENKAVIGLYLPGSTGVTASSVSTITPATGLSSDPRAFLIDFYDGATQKRYNVTKGEVVERGEIPHQNSEMSAYNFTVKMYAYTILTNAASLVYP